MFTVTRKSHEDIYIFADHKELVIGLTPKTSVCLREFKFPHTKNRVF